MFSDENLSFLSVENQGGRKGGQRGKGAGNLEQQKLIVLSTNARSRFASIIGHDLGQRVRIIQKRNHWADLKILS